MSRAPARPRPAPAPAPEQLLGAAGANTLVEALARYLLEEEERAEKLAKRRSLRP